ncbi:hypothetical protein CERSUDRAFT_110218 [Gelatoporia subvermispora B]|uniref:Metallo-beta-lactamase domain-containing protein n=1 Tax=Ceriporiopsis subvermispora (strain B) TaxID=914234 RepID=M2PXM1_CERS8|nr:hypothetical protein CERSUDRAFT_110218 [Gelatoporia subvermispora B]
MQQAPSEPPIAMGSLDIVPPLRDADAELIFLGTGTSSSIPHVDCLTRPPDARPCLTCLSTLTPAGKRNIRRNTSAVVRVRGCDGEPVTIVIDVGKTFQPAAVEWFPKHGLRRIDAVLITHAHADAMNGLDDLRGWTLHGAIQSHIDVYVSSDTFNEVQRSFPYMVAKEYASGGGDVPEFKWHIIEDRVPFEIGETGVQITPFAVHHGRIFATAPSVALVATPNTSVPASPKAGSKAGTPDPPGTPVHTDAALVSAEPPKIQPLLCLGFLIQESILYVSDVSYIPDDIWALFGSLRRPPPVFVLDCLGLREHRSHLSVAQSVATARRLNAARTYLLGFSHEVSHDEYVAMGEAVGGKALTPKQLTPSVHAGLEKIEKGPAVWVRPAFDGLKVMVSGDGGVKDEAYDLN